jgi:hypothetical protein
VTVGEEVGVIEGVPVSVGDTVDENETVGVFVEVWLNVEESVDVGVGEILADCV